MGLDMYLTKRVSVYACYEFEKVTGTIFVSKNGIPVPINFNKITTINEQACYWRKANAIHKWFVDNVQDGEDNCEEYYVPREKLVELVKVCKEVLKNHDKAEQLLPPQAGFFFGGTDIGEWYFEDLKHTVKTISEVLKQDGDNNDIHYYYQSSW